MIWTAPKIWKDETVFIVAGGPSLRGFDTSVLEGKGRVIAINDSWRLYPRADVLYFCDPTWWREQMDMNRRSLDGQYSFHDLIYKGFWVCGTATGFFAEHPQVRQLNLTGQRGLETSPSGLRHGSNSGLQVINLAYHLGAKRIVLLGYDMHVAEPDRNGFERTHWHDEARAAAIAFKITLEKDMLPHFETLVEPLRDAGVEVINATPNSALKCWPYVALKELLETPAAAGKGV